MGAGAAATADCPSIACLERAPFLQSEVVADRGLKAFPLCGGYFGLSLSPLVAVQPHAVGVKRVAPGSTAQSASMARGDSLFAIDGKAVNSSEEVEVMLSALDAGTLVEFSVIRGGQRVELSGTASRRDKAGELGDHMQLGAAIATHAVEDVRYDAGVQLADVDPEGPARAALRVGDAIREVSTESPAVKFEAVANPEALEALLEAVRPGQRVTFVVLRGPEEVRVELQAAERGPHEWL
jgi:S1-C subfamily serine protease